MDGGHGWTESKDKVGSAATCSADPAEPSWESSQRPEISDLLDTNSLIWLGWGTDSSTPRVGGSQTFPPTRLVLTPLSPTKWEAGLGMPHPHAGLTRHPEVPTHPGSPSQALFRVAAAARVYPAASKGLPDQPVRAP